MGTSFSIASPSDCTCNWSDNAKKWFVAGMFISLIVAIIFLYYYYKNTKSYFKYLTYLFVLFAILFSGIMYFDSCECAKGSEYGKFNGVAYPILSIIVFIIILFILNIFPPKPTVIVEVKK